MGEGIEPRDSLDRIDQDFGCGKELLLILQPLAREPIIDLSLATAKRRSLVIPSQWFDVVSGRETDSAHSPRISAPRACCAAVRASGS